MNKPNLSVTSSRIAMMLIATVALASCSESEQDAPPVAQAQSIKSLEKAIVSVDASASTPGDYPIASYKLHSPTDIRSTADIVEASQPILELTLPPVSITRVLDYTLTVTDTVGNYSTNPCTH